MSACDMSWSSNCFLVNNPIKAGKPNLPKLPCNKFAIPNSPDPPPNIFCKDPNNPLPSTLRGEFGIFLAKFPIRFVPNLPGPNNPLFAKKSPPRPPRPPSNAP